MNDVLKVMDILLATCRHDIEHFNVVCESAVNMAIWNVDLGKPIKEPSKPGRNVLRANVGDAYQPIVTHYMLNIYLTLIDSAQTHISDKFGPTSLGCILVAVFCSLQSTDLL
jgi:hypothetical protein